MTVKEAKTKLISEINDVHSNNHNPYDCKYSMQKIIDFIWACFNEKKDKGFIMDTLSNLYNEAGMTECENHDFVIITEIIIETINRKPL